MINVTDTTKSAYLVDSIDKQVTITVPDKNVTFTNTDIIQSSLELTETIETEKNLTFKGCIASQLKFKVADIVTDLRGEYIEAKIQAGETEEIYLFRGYVDTQDNENYEDVITSFTCYDPLYKIGTRNMQSWVDSRTYPITVKNFRDQLFSNLGITQESKTLINDSLSISANLKSFMNAPSAADLMKWICQLNAVYGQYGRDGVFHYRELNALSSGTYPSETLYPGPETYPSAENAGTIIDLSQYIQLTYEPYETERIKKVIIIDGGGLEQGQAGTTGNTFVIQDNPIAFNVNMQTAASNILAKIGYVTHIPVVKMRCVGMPYIECGDTYVSYTRKNICRTYIFQRTLKGIQALIDEYESDTDKEFGAYKATAQTSINAERKSIIDIQADVANFKDITAQNFTAVNGRIDTLAVSDIDAGRIKTGTLDASRVTVKNLNADYISAGTINAQRINVSASGNDGYGNTWSVGMGQSSYFNIGGYNANKLSGIYGGTKTGWGINFNNNTLNVGSITADMITANLINSKIAEISTMTANLINCSGLGTNGINVNNGNISNVQTIYANNFTFRGGGSCVSLTGMQNYVAGSYVKIGSTKYYIQH
jgi:hypothetical protein